MAGTQLPLVGGVSKKALVIGGGAAAAVVAVIWIRKRKAQSVPAAAGTAADTPAADTTGTSDYLSPGLQDTTGGPTYGSTGYTDPNTGQWVYGNTGTGQAAAATNAAWSQMAIAYLSQNGGADPGQLGAALGAYLAGQAVTTAQEGLIDQAIAVEGYPPVSGSGGYPPGIRVSDTGSGAGGTGGSGGGVTGGGGPGPGGHAAGPLPAPSGLRVTNKTAHEFSLAWNPVQGSSSYRVQVRQLNGVVVADFTVSGPGATVGAQTHPGYTYNTGIQALPGGRGTNITVTLPRK